MNIAARLGMWSDGAKEALVWLDGKRYSSNSGNLFNNAACALTQNKILIKKAGRYTFYFEQAPTGESIGGTAYGAMFDLDGNYVRSLGVGGISPQTIVADIAVDNVYVQFACATRYKDQFVVKIFDETIIEKGYVVKNAV